MAKVYVVLRYFAVWLGRNRDPNGKMAVGLPDHFGIPVLWVALHDKYNPVSHANNIALVTTVFPMQFNSFTYPICLPFEAGSDTNNGTKCY